MGRLTKEEINFIKNNPQLTVKEIVASIGHDRHTITKYKKQFGIAFTQTHDFSRYDEYIKENYYKRTAKSLAEEIGCSKEYVQKIWTESNLKGKTNRTYYCDYDSFHIIDNANKAYIIGLLASDGNLYKRPNHQGQIQITLQIQDKDILENICKILHSNHPIKITDTTATITFVSDIMYKDLKNIGLQEQKTWHLQIKTILKNIPKNFHKDFLRGYFDGDGCVTGRDRPSNFDVQFAVPQNISLDFLNLIKECTQEDYSFILDNRSEKYSFPFGAIAAKNTTQKYLLLKLMYDYDNPELYLIRKYNKAHELIKIIEDNTTNRSENITAVTKWGELLETLK